jgi:hypothetical protein
MRSRDHSCNSPRLTLNAEVLYSFSCRSRRLKTLTASASAYSPAPAVRKGKYQDAPWGGPRVPLQGRTRCLDPCLDPRESLPAIFPGESAEVPSSAAHVGSGLCLNRRLSVSVLQSELKRTSNVSPETRQLVRDHSQGALRKLMQGAIESSNRTCSNIPIANVVCRCEHCS